MLPRPLMLSPVPTPEHLEKHTRISEEGIARRIRRNLSTRVLFRFPYRIRRDFPSRSFVFHSLARVIEIFVIFAIHINMLHADAPTLKASRQLAQNEAEQSFRFLFTITHRARFVSRNLAEIMYASVTKNCGENLCAREMSYASGVPPCSDAELPLYPKFRNSFTGFHIHISARACTPQEHPRTMFVGAPKLHRERQAKRYYSMFVLFIARFMLDL